MAIERKNKHMNVHVRNIMIKARNIEIYEMLYEVFNIFFHSLYKKSRSFKKKHGK